MSQTDYKKMSDSEKKKEDWMNSKWRPMMGWSYMLTCIADFVVFPVLWSILQSLSKGQVNVQWQPITLQGAGLYHIAMGAVLGIAAYGRTQEKLGGANNGGIQLPSSGSSTSGFSQPVSTPVANSWGSQPLGSGSTAGSSFTTTSPAGGPTFGTATLATSADVTLGFGGKKAPPRVEEWPER